MKSELLRIAACRGLAPRDGQTEVHRFFPERATGRDNHGTDAKAVCASCPIRATCLVEALRRNEEWGIYGGAGEARRRVLRRAMAAGQLDEVAAAHWRQLDGCPEPGDAVLLSGVSEAMEHGNRATYAKGCRCTPCSAAASFDGVVKSLTPKPRRARARRSAA